MKLALVYGILPVDLRPHYELTGAHGNVGGIDVKRWEALRDEVFADLTKVFVAPFSGTAGKNWDDLTFADWRLMQLFRPNGDWSSLAIKPAGRAKLGDLFDIEDAVNGQAIVLKVNGSHVAVPASFAASFALMVRGIRDFGGPVTALEDFMYADGTSQLENGQYWLLQVLKNKIQRPRPYQVAYEWGYPQFLVKLSSSAQSAALPSGHCLQSLFHAITADHRIPTGSEWDLYRSDLPKWAAGVADRRVYAGLHYPSDNFASWIVVGRLIPIIFNADDVAHKRAVAVAVQSISASICWDAAKNLPEFIPARNLLIDLFEGLA